jgi:hypothetical protein
MRVKGVFVICEDSEEACESGKRRAGEEEICRVQWRKDDRNDGGNRTC